MTSTNKRDGGEVELLPLLDSYQTMPGLYNANAMQAYARANVERALAESRAQEAESFQKYVDANEARIEAEARAERLVVALQNLLGSVDDLTSYMAEDDEIGYRPCCNVLSYNDHADDCAITQARAALEPQE